MSKCKTYLPYLRESPARARMRDGDTKGLELFVNYASLLQCSSRPSLPLCPYRFELISIKRSNKAFKSPRRFLNPRDKTYDNPFRCLHQPFTMLRKKIKVNFGTTGFLSFQNFILAGWTEIKLLAPVCLFNIRLPDFSKVMFGWLVQWTAHWALVAVVDSRCLKIKWSMNN